MNIVKEVELSTINGGGFAGAFVGGFAGFVVGSVIGGIAGGITGNYELTKDWMTTSTIVGTSAGAVATGPF